MTKPKTNNNSLLKNEASLVKTLDTFHATLDGVFFGIVEPDRRTSNINNNNDSILNVHGDPLIILKECGKKLLDLLDNAAVTGPTTDGFYVDTIVIMECMLRMLKVQNSSPVKEVNFRTGKQHLTKIHTYTFELLQELALRLDNLPAVDNEIIGFFITKYHVSLVGSELFIAILRYLKVCKCSFEILLKFGRQLLTVCIEVLKTVNCDSAANKESENRKLSFTKKDKSSPIIASSLSINPEHVKVILEWIQHAFSIATFNASINQNLKMILNDYISKLDHYKVQRLQAISSIVLGNQPALLSPSLPLLMRLVSNALYDEEVASIAIDIARSIDLLVRPRRPFTPRSSIITEQPSETIMMDYAGIREVAVVNVDKSSSQVKVGKTEDIIEKASETILVPSASVGNTNLTSDVKSRLESSSITSGRGGDLSKPTMDMVPTKRRITEQQSTVTDLSFIDLGKNDDGNNNNNGGDNEPLPKLVDESSSEQDY